MMMIMMMLLRLAVSCEPVLDESLMTIFDAVRAGDSRVYAI